MGIEGKTVTGVRAFVARHRAAVALTGLAMMGGFLIVLIWFQPQKIFLTQSVEEAAPNGAATTLASGSFRSLEHETSGQVLVLELPDGSRSLRLEDLHTLNGPDLHVYLSRLSGNLDARSYGMQFVDLGKLKGNVGSQNYSLPGHLDLSSFRSVVIWCKRFSVGFAVAALE